jgi:hypothetical protein
MDTIALEALCDFRRQVYTTLGCRRDALFEMMDAVLTAPHTASPVYLSQELHFGRKWGRVYDALQAGTLAGAACEDLLGTYPLAPDLPIYAVDVTVRPRCDATNQPPTGVLLAFASPLQRAADCGWLGLSVGGPHSSAP